jgi:hypothetical protein
MIKKPGTIIASQILFWLNAAIWLVFGGINLVRMTSSSETLTLVMVAILMFGNAVAMLLAGIGIGKRRSTYLFLAVLLLGVNILLTFTDQVGAFDLVTLATDTILLMLLYLSRWWYLK